MEFKIDGRYHHGDVVVTGHRDKLVVTVLDHDTLELVHYCFSREAGFVIDRVL